MSLLTIFHGCNHPSKRREKISTIVSQDTFLLATMLSGIVLSTTQIRVIHIGKISLVEHNLLY